MIWGMTRTEALQVGQRIDYFRTIFVTSEGTMVEITTYGAPVASVRELTGEEAVREIERERSDRSDA